MTTQISRRGASVLRWLAIGAVGTTLQFAAAHTFAAKSVTLAVASTFTTMDPYDANDTLSLAVM